jgi:hypothetical protein
MQQMSAAFGTIKLMANCESNTARYGRNSCYSKRGLSFNRKTGKSFALCLLALTYSEHALAKDKDLRTMSDSVGVTRVGFCARPSPASFGFPGHAFAAFIEEPVGGQFFFRAVGHTVASGTSPIRAALTYLGAPPIDGKLAEERYTDAQQQCLTVTVNRIDYDRAVSAARPTLTALGVPDQHATYGESYSLNEADCVDYVVKVASSLKGAGLNVPARSATDTPFRYIDKLLTAN